MNASLGSIPVSPAPPRRWEPWPIGIAAFLALFVAGVATFITFAVGQRMDLVRPDYYEEEIRYQIQFDRLKRTRELGSAAGLSVDATSGRLSLRIPVAHLAGLSGGTIQLYRPSDASRDRELRLEPGADGTQVVSLAGLEPGRWRAKVRWSAGGLEYHMEETLEMGRGR